MKYEGTMKRQRTLNLRGTLLSLEKPIVMGILNLTPDSFHRGSRIQTVEDAMQRTASMLSQGASIIDIGAASSRPGAEVVSVSEELDRLQPVLEALLESFPDAVFSVDTWRVSVAESALKRGAHMINDISAGTIEPEILSVVADHGVPYVAMHMLGTPGNMPVRPQYEDVAGEVLRYLVTRVRDLRRAGLQDIILDPGFGFGKSVENNFDLLEHLEVFRFLELPILVGLSRKSMVWRTLGITAEEALNGTTALHMIALQKGADILRVHDVREAVEAITLHCRLSGKGIG